MQESEVRWIRRSDDLGMVSPDAEHAWLNGFVESAISKLSRRLTMVSMLSFPQITFAHPKTVGKYKVLDQARLRGAKY